MTLLNISLLGNAVFSLLSGIALILLRNQFMRWFGLQTFTVFLVIGVGLIIFSYTIFIEVQNPRPDAVFYIVVQDLIWIIASIIFLLVKPFNISTLGHKIIAGIGLIVMLFAIGQSFGLAKIDSFEDTGMKRIVFQRIINASKKETWQVIADVGNYHKVAPNIDTVKIISGSGEGMVRSCSHNTEHWTEVATLWEDGEEYSFRVNTEAKDYPYPLSHLQGTWKLQAISDHQTKVMMVFDFTFKRPIYNMVMYPFMKKEFVSGAEELLDNWQSMLE